MDRSDWKCQQRLNDCRVGEGSFKGSFFHLNLPAVPAGSGGGCGVGVALALTRVGGVVAGVRVREAAGDRRVRLRVVPAPSVVVVGANDGRGGGAERINAGGFKPQSEQLTFLRKGIRIV